MLELLRDLIPVVILILIPLWDAVKDLFYQHTHTVLVAHKFPNDSCDNIEAGRLR